MQVTQLTQAPSGHCVRFFTQQTQAPANRNGRSKQPIMVAKQALAFFVYATHASHTTRKRLRCVRCVRLNGNRASVIVSARFQCSYACKTHGTKSEFLVRASSRPTGGQCVHVTNSRAVTAQLHRVRRSRGNCAVNTASIQSGQRRGRRRM